MLIRNHSRFFERVGHETIYAYNIFIESCHRHTYQNYQQPPQRLQNSDFLSHSLALKISGIFPIFSVEKY